MTSLKTRRADRSGWQPDGEGRNRTRRRGVILGFGRRARAFTAVECTVGGLVTGPERGNEQEQQRPAPADLVVQLCPGHGQVRGFSSARHVCSISSKERAVP